MKRATAVLCLLLLELPALAAPRRVLVLPLDGNADAATRQKLTASVQRLARVIDATVQPGDTTFAETAAAVGCDPAVPACADTVRETLNVDELVYGTANVEGGKVTIVVRRKAKGADAREVKTTMAASDSIDQVEPALLPLFSASSTTQPAVTEPIKEPDKPPTELPPVTGSGQPGETQTRRDRTPMSTDKKFGIAAVVGGGLLLVFGLAAWGSAGDVNEQIDNHDTETYEDFQQLQELESRARTRAWAGNILVLGGLALGGYGGYLLWRDHKAKLTVTPTPVEGGGAALTFTYGALK
ncbi:MAG TPA: hypothetical protein VIU61_18000 [Kofleriaceae bacterium]